MLQKKARIVPNHMLTLDKQKDGFVDAGPCCFTAKQSAVLALHAVNHVLNLHDVAVGDVQ